MLNRIIIQPMSDINVTAIVVIVINLAFLTLCFFPEI